MDMTMVPVRTEHRHTCPLCGRETTSPSWLLGRAWCRSCEEYVAPCEITIQRSAAFDAKRTER